MKSYAYKNCYKTFLNHLLWFVAAFTIIIGFETVLISLFTGFTPNKFSFLLWDKFHFFFTYFLEEPVETLSFILIDKPLFKIEALQESPTTVIWGLHYYGVSLFTHIVVAILASRVINKHTFLKSALLSLPFSGIILLIFSSLFLYLSSCCTAGANWIIHTWILAVVFDPYTASETLIDIYNYIQDWFIWFQLLIATSGAYLIFLKLKNEVKR